MQDWYLYNLTSIQFSSCSGRGTELYCSLKSDRAGLFIIKGQSFIVHWKVTKQYSFSKRDRALLFIAKWQNFILHCKGTELYSLSKRDRALLFIAKVTELYSSLQRDSFSLHCKGTELLLFFVQRDRDVLLITKEHNFILHHRGTEL